MMEQLTDDEIRLTKWFDGELTSDEISDLLAKNPELYQQRMEIEDMGEMVRLHAQPSVEFIEPPFPELFNRQIQRRISETPLTRFASWLELARDWFTASQWTVPATAMIALSGILLSGIRLGSAQSHSEVVHTFAPHPEHSASAQYIPLAKATIIRLEGLEAMDAKTSITGYFRGLDSQSGALASTVVFPHQGQPIPRSEIAAAPARLQLASSHVR